MSRKQENHLEVMSIGGFSWSTNDSLQKLWSKYDNLLNRFEEDLRLYIREHASETELEFEEIEITTGNSVVETHWRVVDGCMGNPAHYLLVNWDFSARHFMMLSLEEHEKNLCMILEDVINEEGVQWTPRNSADAHMLYNIIWLDEGTNKCRAFVEFYWEDDVWA